MCYPTGCRSLELLADVFLAPAGHNNSERKLTVLLECINDHLNKPRDQGFVIALVESVNDHDHGFGPRLTGMAVVSCSLYWFNDQFYELVFNRLTNDHRL